MANNGNEIKVVERDFATAIEKIGLSRVSIIDKFNGVIDKMNEAAQDEYWVEMNRDMFEAAINKMCEIRDQYQTNLWCLNTLLKEVHVCFTECDDICAKGFKNTDAMITLHCML